MTLATCRERIADWSEPVLTLEWRRFNRHGLTAILVFAAIVAIIPPLTVLYWRPDPSAARMTLTAAAALYAFLILLMVPAYGARTISRERETRVWDMIAMTVISSSRMADQRIAAASLPMLMLMVAAVPLVLVLGLLGAATAAEICVYGAVFVLTVLSVAAWSVEASSDCTPSSATTVAYLPLLVHFCGGIALLGCLVGVIILLASPDRKGQAGRLLLGGLCILIGSSVEQYAATISLMRVFTFGSPGLGWSWLQDLPPYAIQAAELGTSMLMFIGLRCVLRRSIEKTRRTQ